MNRILVTGGTGQVGREVVSQLRDLGGSHVRIMSRHPESVATPEGVEVVGGDLSDATTLDRALDGVDVVFLVWVAPFAAAPAAIERIASHARRIVFVSSPHQTQHPFFQQPNVLRAVHAGLDRLVMDSGCGWTVLRPGAFALNCRNWWAPQIRNGDVVRWFHGDAATAPIHERDIAAVAVHAVGDEAHDGKDYVLTGPASLTQREQVRTIGEAIGRPLRFDEASPAEGRELLMRMMPPAIADMLLSAYGAAVGQPAFVTSTVADITGTPARNFAAWAADHAADFS